jgi:hypothetical protein
MTFAEILDHYGVHYETEGKHTRRGWVQLDCPWCSGELYLGYNIAGNYCNCWRCGSHSTLDVLVSVTRANYPAVIGLYKQLDRADYEKPHTVVCGKLLVPQASFLEKAHVKYLHEVRGFRHSEINELVKLWKIRGIGPFAPKLTWRILIPIEYRSEVVSWTTRSIGEFTSVRYVSASPSEERMHHKHLLYGEDYARASIIVCEGPIDVWKIGPGAVATLGVGYTGEQLLRMSRYPHRAIWFDNEPDARQRARRLRDDLTAFPGTTYVIMSDAKDAGSAKRSEIAEVRRRFLL